MDGNDDLDTVVAGSIAAFGVIVRSLAPAMDHVTMQQYRVLVLVVMRGPMRSSDLAEELGLLPSGLTRIVNRLVAGSYATRARGVHSRREVIVDVTESGRLLVQEVLRRRREEYGALMATMTGAERRAMVKASAALSRVVPGEPVEDASVLLGGTDEGDAGATTAPDAAQPEPTEPDKDQPDAAEPDPAEPDAAASDPGPRS